MATVREALGYAMSLPVATAISRIDSLFVLHQNLAIAPGFQPMSTGEMERPPAPPLDAATAAPAACRCRRPSAARLRHCGLEARRCKS